MTKKLTDDQKSAVMDRVSTAPKQPRFRYEIRDGWWHKVLVATNESVNHRCWGCGSFCDSFFKIPPERVSDD